jgi:1,4-alpha-glucan branching enzyme
MMRDMNHLYRDIPALYEVDFESHGFEWIDCNDAQHSTISYIRRDKHGGFVVVVLNLTPVVRENYRLGVPEAGYYREVMNTDSELYGGSNIGNVGGVDSDAVECMQKPHSIQLTLPPLSCVILRRE